MDQTRQPGIRIAQIFLERAHFSHREDALQLPPGQQFNPGLSFGVRTAVASDEQSGFVRIEVKTKPEEKSLYNLDLSMIALVEVDKEQKNLPLKEYLGGPAPVVMLIPFVREAVAALTGRGRFGPLWMGPLNIAAAINKGEEAPPKIERPSRTLKKRPRTKQKTQ